MTAETQTINAFLSKELFPGALLRKPTGALYVICGGCLEEPEGGPMVLYRALDTGEDPHLRACLVSTLREPLVSTGAPPFSLLAMPDQAPLKQFWKTHFKGDLSKLESLLQRYTEPWRFLHTQRYVYRLFEIAQAIAQPLTREEGLALLLHKVALVPGASAQVQRGQSLLVGQSLGCLPGKKINWHQIADLWDPQSKGQVRDLLQAPVAYEVLEFCVNEELAWLESRALFAGPDGRKEYETQRLKELITLAGQGPIYTRLPETYERRARVNIEGLRQAWRQKYAKA